MAIFWVVWFGVGVMAHAAPPPYLDDPFGDDDLAGASAIVAVSHPTASHGEAAVTFVSSVVDKYTAHVGGLVDVQYNVLESLGVGLSLGFFHGGLTPIVTDHEGIISSGMAPCAERQRDADAATATQAQADEVCARVNPHLPDYKQITGLASAYAVWSPLYGKVNIVSEVDVNVRVYGLLGLGYNGTRQIVAVPGATRRNVDDYTLRGGDFFAGGAFAGGKAHFTTGGGLKVYVAERVALKGEIRGVFFRDRYVGGGESFDYISRVWLVAGGVAVTFL